jgi:hypothetical protein
MKLEELKYLIEDRFLDIVVKILQPSPEKLRLILKDGSFIDIRISQTFKNRFDFHLERRHIDNTIYRYDNFPDLKFKNLKTFPYHFHKKKENKVENSPFRKKLPYAFIDFMEFVRKEMNKRS